MAVLTGVDFFIVEVLGWRGFTLAGITRHSAAEWMLVAGVGQT